MSHFTTLVIVEPDLTDPDAIQARIAELLAPYDENKEVDPYPRECYCVGDEAQSAGYRAAEEQYPIDALRAQLRAEFRADQFDSEACDARWDQLIAPRKALQEAVAQAHPAYGQPNPACGECGGTGTYQSTYNPKSKWDWWAIGGRWYGVLVGREETSDNGFNFSLMRAREREGARLLADNSGIVAELDPQIVNTHVYAIISPDGAWHAKGRMGWFGVSSGERDDWDQRKQQVLSEFPRYRAVLCDLHI